MLNVVLILKYYFGKLEKHMIFKFVAVSRSSQTLKILHNTITVKPQSHYVNFILISTVLMNKQPDYRM